jgi:hypothetical protein
MTEQLKKSGAMTGQMGATSGGLAIGLGTAAAVLLPIDDPDTKTLLASAFTAIFAWLLPNKPPWKK